MEFSHGVSNKKEISFGSIGQTGDDDDVDEPIWRCNGKRINFMRSELFEVNIGLHHDYPHCCLPLLLILSQAVYG